MIKLFDILHFNWVMEYIPSRNEMTSYHKDNCKNILLEL